MNMRTPENQAAYETFKQTYEGECVFCDMSEREPKQILETNETMMIVENYFPYHIWDNFVVADHRMIVPKRHLGSLDTFNEKERSDYFDLLRQYEAEHYSFYSRAPSNTSRTVYHLHTHLFKPIGY
jgi:diadenosine tetraphosphate (Ap4A) HIT family hydrolase